MEAQQASTAGGAGLKVIVVGGGIGGMSAAIALRQAGLDVAVFERRDDARQINAGAGMVLWHNAMRALQRLDVADRLTPVGSALDRAEWQSVRGPMLARWRVGDMERELHAPALGVRRAELHRVLLASLPDDVVRLGTECTGFVQDRDGVTASFADGHEERGDVLVGADGINSTVRAQLLGRERPRYAGYALWFGLVEPGRVRAPEATFREVAGPGARVFFFPVGEGYHYWSAVRNAPEGGTDGDGGAVPVLRSAFRGWPEPVEELLAATDEATIFRRDIVDRAPVKRWGTGRVTLLGDAAHPITPNLGQGAAQAIEGAVVLADRLREAADPEPALRAYEERRMGRTASLTNRSHRIGTMGRWEHPLACRVRERVMRAVFPTVAWRQHRKDMAHQL